MVTQLGEAELEDLAVGAALLGTGGGGDPYVGKQMAQQAVSLHGPVRLISPSELADDDLVIPIAQMGAPTVTVEKIPGAEAVQAFLALEAMMGRKARAVLAIEAGGINSTIPIAVAAQLGLPLVDADGMGRAFPELQMVTFTIFGIPATPMAMADEKGNALTLNCIDNRWTERFARSVCVDMGCTAMIAIYPLTGKQIREAAVQGTISHACRIGEAVRTARQAGVHPVEAVAEATGAFRLFSGKVVDVVRKTGGGFARGTAQLEGVGAWAGQTCSVDFQNEHLVARSGAGEVLCSVPDLIAMLDSDTGEPFTTEALRYGFRVELLGIPCDSRWRLPGGLALVGPQYFGYDFNYIPVETRAAKR